GALILVGLLNFAVLTGVALGFRLPAAHAVALVSLTVSYVAGYHLVLGWPSELSRPERAAWLVPPTVSGGGGAGPAGRGAPVGGGGGGTGAPGGGGGRRGGGAAGGGRRRLGGRGWSARAAQHGPGRRARRCGTGPRGRGRRLVHGRVPAAGPPLADGLAVPGR